MFDKTLSRLRWYHLWSGLQSNFPSKTIIGSVEYNFSPAISSRLRETLYQELGLEFLKLRRWYKKPCCFYKIDNKQAHGHLTELIPTHNESY